MPAQVHTALALARREVMLEGHTKQKQRGRIVATLEHALEKGVPTAAGWLMLAEMYLKDGQAAAALKAAKAGLKYVNERSRKYHKEPMVQVRERVRGARRCLRAAPSRPSSAEDGGRGLGLTVVCIARAR